MHPVRITVFKSVEMKNASHCHSQEVGSFFFAFSSILSLGDSGSGLQELAFLSDYTENYYGPWTAINKQVGLLYNSPIKKKTQRTDKSAELLMSNSLYIGSYV